MCKKLLIVLSIIGSVALVSGCDGTHEYAPATCQSPARCVTCGKTKGDPLEHIWQEADCDNPRTCSVCGTTEGEALGHNWTEPSCLEARTCLTCGATLGDPYPHTWIEATCISPRHCVVCGTVEGDYAPHSWIAASYNEPKTCAICGATEGAALQPYSANGQFVYSLNQGAMQAYSTITGYDNSLARGSVTVLEYNKYTSDATHPMKEGYEWREVKLQFDMDKHCRIMWGYTDSYLGLSEYARSDYITHPDGSRESVMSTQSFYTEAVPITPGTTGVSSNNGSTTGTSANGGSTEGATQTPAATAAPTQSASATPGASDSSSSKPGPTPAPGGTVIVPTPTASPVVASRYVSYLSKAVQVPVDYKGLVFYVCDADYERNHIVDNSFLYMQMD